MEASGYAKLTDFGFAKIVEPGARTSPVCECIFYFASVEIISCTSQHARHSTVAHNIRFLGSLWSLYGAF